MLKTILINSISFVFIALTFLAVLIGDSGFPELFGITVK